MFAEDRDVASPSVLDELLSEIHLDGPATRAEAESPEHKGTLRAATTEAMQLGTFAAPTFVAAGEMSWGNALVGARARVGSTLSQSS